MWIRSILMAHLVLLAGSCSKDSPKERPAASEAKHAPSDVKPGSHEDWCDEHGVPESQCTKCNPDLKIVRPPKAAGQ